MTTTYFAKFNDEGLPEGFIPSFHVNNYGGKNKLTSDGYIEISLEEYNYYIGNMSNEDNNYAKFKRDNQTGKPVIYIPPEPTQEEKQLTEVNNIANDTKIQAEEIKEAMIIALLNDDTELQEELKQEYQELMLNANNEMKGVIENDKTL